MVKPHDPYVTRGCLRVSHGACVMVARESEMRKNITLTGYLLREGRKTRDTARGNKKFLLDEGQRLVDAASEDEEQKVRNENQLTFTELLALARKNSWKLTPTYSRS